MILRTMAGALALASFFSAHAEEVRPRPVGDWLVLETTDPFDRSQKIVASTVADDRRAGMGLRCIGEHGSFVLNQPGAQHSVGETLTVMLRPDRGRPTELDGTAASATGTVVEAGPALADLIAEGGSIGIRVTNQNNLVASYRFRSAGAELAIKPVKKACGWD